MAAEVNRIRQALRGFLPVVLGESPDKKGGYHGCPPRQRGSSLKLRGKRGKLPAIPVAVFKVADDRTEPPDSEGGRR